MSIADRTERNGDDYQTPRVPSVYYVIDAHGSGWYCTDDDPDEFEEGGTCVHEDDVPYDRNFGG
jgi:hypothetical protein